jgi:hypothetical protein
LVTSGRDPRGGSGFILCVKVQPEKRVAKIAGASSSAAIECFLKNIPLIFPSASLFTQPTIPRNMENILLGIFSLLSFYLFSNRTNKKPSYPFTSATRLSLNPYFVFASAF